MDAEAHAGGGEVGGRAVEHHPALEHDHVVEVVGDRAELVRHEQHRGVVLLHEVHERVAEQLLRLDVDAGDRFVEHEQLRIGGERARDQRALLLPARELVQPLAPLVGERDRFERVVDRVAVGGASPSPPSLLGQPAGRHHLLDGGGEIGRDARALRHVPDPPAVVEIVGRDAEHRDRARPAARAARAGCAGASTCPSRWARRARRTRRRAPRGSRARARPRRRRRTTRRSPRARPARSPGARRS